MRRNLDGCYFRVYRDGKWQNICFSDLTEMEQDEVLANKGADYLKNLCKRLASVINKIGDETDLRYR